MFLGLTIEEDEAENPKSKVQFFKSGPEDMKKLLRMTWQRKLNYTIQKISTGAIRNTEFTKKYQKYLN